MNNFIDKLENKKGLIIIGIFLLILSIASGTFAFWSWTSSDEERTDVVIEVPDVCIVSVDGGGVFNSSMAHIVPTTCTNSNNAIIREVTVNVDLVPEEGSSTTVNIWLKKDAIGIDQTYLDTVNFRYALTTSPISCTSNVVSSGTFQGVSIGSDIKILNKVYTYEGVQNITENFYLFIWLDKDETDISTAGKHFNIVMDANCSNYAEGIILSYDLKGGSGTFVDQTYENTEGESNISHTFTIPNTIPTKSGSTFLGWTTSENSNVVEYNPGDTITLTDNTKLYAIWQSSSILLSNQSFNVIYNANSSITKTISPATNGSGNYTYSITGNGASNFSISGTTLTIAAGANAGTYNLTVSATDSQTGFTTEPGATFTVVIAKASNPMTVSATQSWSSTYSSSAQTKSLPTPVNAQGNVTYSLISQKNASNTDVSYFSISGSTLTMAANTESGNYSVVIRATAAGNNNYNSKTQDITMSVVVNKKANTITISTPQTWEPTYSTSAQTKEITAATNGQGTVSYSLISQKNASDADVTNFSLSGTTLTMAANTSGGNYSLVIRATAAGDDNYESGYKDVTMYVVVGKLSNPITISTPQTWSTEYSTSAQTKEITAATNGEGTVTYAIISQKNASDTNVSYFSLSGTTLTMAANTSGGNYSVVIRATAAGNSNYYSSYKDITMNVTVEVN